MKCTHKLNKIIDNWKGGLDLSANDHIGDFRSLEDYIDEINEKPEHYMPISLDVKNKLLEANTIYHLRAFAKDIKSIDIYGINFSDVVDQLYVMVFPEETFIPSDQMVTIFDQIVKRCKYDVTLDINEYRGRDHNMTIHDFIELIG